MHCKNAGEGKIRGERRANSRRFELPSPLLGAHPSPHDRRVVSWTGSPRCATVERHVADAADVVLGGPRPARDRMPVLDLALHRATPRDGAGEQTPEQTRPRPAAAAGSLRTFEVKSTVKSSEGSVSKLLGADRPTDRESTVSRSGTVTLVAYMHTDIGDRVCLLDSISHRPRHRPPLFSRGLGGGAAVAVALRPPPPPALSG